VTVCYGPAGSPDVAWLGGILYNAEQAFDGPRICVGDFNWRPCYDGLASAPWSVAVTPPTTRIGTARPTRCVISGGEVTSVDTVCLAAVPHHMAVLYRTSLKVGNGFGQVPLRVKHTAQYQWATAPLPSEELGFRAAAETAACAPSLFALLSEAWTAWHGRAEAVLRHAAECELATMTVRAERSKGSDPMVKQKPAAAAHRANECVMKRWVRKLQRQAAEQCRFGDKGACLSAKAVRSWQRLLQHKNIHELDSCPRSWEEAEFAASALYGKIEAKEAVQRSIAYRRRFRTMCREVIKDGAKILKQEQVATFSAQDMHDDWKDVWCPPSIGGDETGSAWIIAAEACGMERAAERVWQPPSFEAFATAIKNTDGAAGWDGWQAAELHALVAYAPWCVYELYQLLLRTMDGATTDDGRQACRRLLAWRVVGVPKRNPLDSRPICVASVIIRAWNRTLLHMLPPLPPEQFGERGVHAAIASWLLAEGQAGGEIDLEKAFDTVAHGAGAESLRFGGTPAIVVDWMLESWNAPRRCHVHGDMSEEINPCGSIPAGDPLSMRTLGGILAPWHKIVKMECPTVNTWAYADDRSLKANRDAKEFDSEEAATTAATSDITAALQFAADIFDRPIGLRENVKKRQRWSGSADAEHLGVRAVGSSNPAHAAPCKLRDGWEPIIAVAMRLSHIPGALEVRERIAASCVLPMARWAAPFIEPPPLALDRAVMRAVVRTGNTWWCLARFWADRAQVCPTMATAIQTLKTAGKYFVNIPLSVKGNICRHAALLGLDLVDVGEDGQVWVTPGADADYRLVDIAEEASLAAEVPWVHRLRGGVFCASDGKGQHTCRLAARIACLNRRRGKVRRNDDDGLEHADVEVLSTPTWQSWVRSLDARKRGALRIWRSGAVMSPARLQSMRKPDCPWCGATMASARHLWADCYRFQPLRDQLQADVGFDAGWWGRQPHCTAKSGWVTFDSARTLTSRAKAAVAANSLGISIISELMDTIWGDVDFCRVSAKESLLKPVCKRPRPSAVVETPTVAAARR
jgi:hypothetical protein